MTVFCKRNQCPYFNQSGFCGKQTIAIDELGMCSVWWKRGQQKAVIIQRGDRFNSHLKQKIQVQDVFIDTIEKE